MKATVVIGSAWGDEGKGLMTDYHATPDSVVVRFNGGAQAGHTVCRDGKRHVFHHFGSGSLRGAKTFLSAHFINNPILYFKELDVLRSLGCEPVVHVDPNGLVTTPFDMMINQIVEEARGDSRHGSCGVGINETIKRHEQRFPITVGALRSPKYLEGMLRCIQKVWVPARLQKLDVEPSSEWLERLESEDILNTYLEHCAEFVKAVSFSSPQFLAYNNNIVFEGAQGLLLDEDHYFFPHVTHSHTGLTNVNEIANQIGIEQLDVIYATRAYATRHGAGPFPREVAGLTYEDQTNVHNMWQGTIRFGHLDLDLLAESILADLGKTELPVTLGLAVTCLDQVSDPVSFWHRGELQTESRDELLRRVFTEIGAKIRLSSFGPTADDVRYGIIEQEKSQVLPLAAE